MLTIKEHDELYEKLENQKIIFKNDKAFFIAKKSIFDVLCFVDIKKYKQFVLNKKRNSITQNKEIFDEYLEKQRNEVYGYKTAIMGIIENYYYYGNVNYAVVGSDIDGYYWWVDWENKVKIPTDIKKILSSHIKKLQSDFKRVK